MKTSKRLALILSTALFTVSSASATIPATATIPTKNVNLISNKKIIGFDEGKAAVDMFGNPIREIADPYFENRWYASLYPEVKEQIDQNYYGGNRTNEYFRICRMIADKYQITVPGSYIPIASDVSNYIFNRTALVVKDEGGTVNCFHRTSNFSNQF